MPTPCIITNSRLPVKTAKRLKTVEVRANGVLQRAYKLDYFPTGSPIQFQYYGNFGFAQSLPGASLATNSYMDSANKTPLVGDWNGDGLSDMLLLYNSPDPQYSWVALSNGDGTFTFDNTKLPGASLATNSYMDSANKTPLVGDWNGDGLSDMLLLYNSPDPQYSWVALSNGDGTFTFDNTKLPGASLATNSYMDSANKTPLVGDWNGDGLSDMLLLYNSPDPQYSWVALSNGDGTFTFSQSLPGASVATNSYMDSANKTPLVGDWNGDGLSDMLLLYNSPDPQYSWVALSNGDGTFTFSQSLPGASVATNSYMDSANKTPLVGDWNGDGLSDMLLLYNSPDPQYSWVALSNGDGTFTFSQSLPGASVATNSYMDSANKTPLVGDWNGDGLTDMLHLHPQADPQYSWVALSNGDGTFTFSQSLPGASVATNSYMDSANKTPLVGDWNGDGLTDMLHLHPQADPQWSWVALSTGSNGVLLPTSSSRSLISSIQQFGKDAVIDAVGTVLSGTSLPPITFTTSDEGLVEFLPVVTRYQTVYPWNSLNVQTLPLDLNGDSISDYCISETKTAWQTKCALGLGDGNFTWVKNDLHVSSGNWVTTNKILPGDYNGDGQADLCASVTYTGGWRTECVLGKGDGTFEPFVSTTHSSGSWGGDWVKLPGDYNGDGLTDVCISITYTGGWRTECALGKGDGTFEPFVSTTHSSGSWGGDWVKLPGDYNGDGLTDVCISITYTGGWRTECALGKGDGTFEPFVSTTHSSGSWGGDWVKLPGDYNGDGLTDVCISITYTGGWKTECALGKGDGTFEPFIETIHSTVSWTTTWKILPGDYNGDEITDLCASYTNSSVEWQTNCVLSQGDGSFTPLANNIHSTVANSVNWNILPGDYNGDGITDLCASYLVDTYGTNYFDFKTDCVLKNGSKPFLLTQIDNGLGGSTLIEYAPSTEFSNTLLPYVTQVVDQITTDDGNGNVSATTYGYAGGYFHLAEREFRGFHYAKSTGPAGPNGEQTVSETWFHQGNDTAVGVNNPGAPDGYLKGAPYQTQVSDGLGNLYTSTATTYTPDSDGVAPFYTPPAQVIADVCDGNASCVQTQTDFTYDIYGNILQGISYGDVTDPADDRTRVNTYAYNTTDWLLSFPSSATLYEGIGTAGTMMSHADLYYDGTTSCAVASTNQVPTKGLLTRSVNWLNGGTSPETSLAYNALGNPICSRDANGNESTTAYDSQGVFETSSTNALGHATTTQYYGVDGVLQDNGLYGQIKQVTDPNAATVSSTYDKLGRVLTVTQPDGFTVTKSYVGLGTVGTQHVRTDNDLGLSSWVYFDGLGRTIKTESTGTDSKIIVTDTEYNVRGAVHRCQSAVFQGGRCPIMGYPNLRTHGTGDTHRQSGRHFTLQCYDDWTSVAIDANGHKSRQTRNSFGKPLTIQEYQGVFTSCDTALGTPYSTTTYQYDVQGKFAFHDGCPRQPNGDAVRYACHARSSCTIRIWENWSYAYDAMDNLTLQTDAKGQLTYLQYDALNRVVQKDYATQKALGSGDVVNTYDGITSNGIGRLTQVNDSSGSNTLYYDTKGQLARSDQVINSTTYTTQTAYDGLGRTTSITYPDNSVVTYTYNGPQLATVVEGSTTHISYGGYNAQGQPATATYGNGVTTSYTYNPLNTRLDTLQTVNGISTTFMDLDYAFDACGQYQLDHRSHTR